MIILFKTSFNIVIKVVWFFLQRVMKVFQCVAL